MPYVIQLSGCFSRQCVLTNLGLSISTWTTATQGDLAVMLYMYT